METVGNAGAHLMGANTYAVMAAFWPGAAGPFATPMNEIPKVVFSNSLTSADWGETTIATGDLAASIMRLKQERSGGYLLAHGGARFARSLVETGLIDEYRLLIHPVVLGEGERSSTRPSPSSPRAPSHSAAEQSRTSSRRTLTQPESTERHHGPVMDEPDWCGRPAPVICWRSRSWSRRTALGCTPTATGCSPPRTTPMTRSRTR